MITQELLRKRFEYKDGQLIYKEPACRNRIKAGDIAGGFEQDGYSRVMINYGRYPLHRLIYIYHNGDIPADIKIDHINSVREDNCIENLRLATSSQNQHNRSKSKNNSSGYKGVYWDKKLKNWRAMIGIDNKKIHLGNFSTPELASEAYNSAADKLHKEFANY